MTMLMLSKAPPKARRKRERKNDFESPKPTMQTPKPATAASKILPEWLLIGLRVKASPIRTAPTEGAARKTPKPPAPTFKISPAKMGRRATQPPNKTPNISKVKAARRSWFENTNLKPAVTFSRRVLELA